MLRYYEVARAIGSRRDHIKRNLDALAVYEIIKKNDFYGIEKLDEETIKFSVLSTALADERLGQFVGVSIEDDGDTIPSHPIINSKSLKN
ncbi:chromosome partitioning protein ParB, partial [Salmonella enterica]|nr:chromosome partitioning protein ParB [Salmonella enterica]